MGLFTEAAGQSAVIIEGGVFKQVPVYTRDGYMFAKLGGGFVRLMSDGSTSKPKCRLDYLDFDGTLGTDQVGRLVDASKFENAKALPHQRLVTLGLEAPK